MPETATGAEGPGIYGPGGVELGLAAGGVTGGGSAVGVEGDGSTFGGNGAANAAGRWAIGSGWLSRVEDRCPGGGANVGLASGPGGADSSAASNTARGAAGRAGGGGTGGSGATGSAIRGPAPWGERVGGT